MHTPTRSPLSCCLYRTVFTTAAVCLLLVCQSAFAAEPGAAAGEGGNSPVDSLSLQIVQAEGVARQRAQIAAQLCLSEANEILNRSFPALHRRNRRAMQQIACYSNCVKMIGMLAYDKVRGRTTCRAWLDRKLAGQFDGPAAALQQELQTTLDRFNQEMARATAGLAVAVAGPGINADVTATVPDPEAIVGVAELDSLLGDLGFEGGLAGTVALIDIAAVANTVLGRKLTEQLVNQAMQLVAWIFARPLAAAVAEVGVAAADGPLPIGDAIAAVGAVWTAYDIWHLRHAFEAKLRNAATARLESIRADLGKTVHRHVRQSLESHEQARERIAKEARAMLLAATPGAR